MASSDLGRYNPDLDGKGTGQLTVNEKAIVGAEHRLFRVAPGQQKNLAGPKLGFSAWVNRQVWFVALLKPDIICLQDSLQLEEEDGTRSEKILARKR